MRLPDWIGIGCVKCGTSWLWREMKSHPQLYSPKVKEMHFFNNAVKRSMSVYMKQLGRATDEQKTGEFTPDYFHHYEAMHLIKEYSPQSKLIVSFRHPLERAFSNWKHATNAGRFDKNKTFMDSFEFWRVRERSIYSRWLKQWYALFPKEQIHIVWYDDIESQPVKVLKEVWKFLGVDESFVPDSYKDWFKFSYHEHDKKFNAQKPTPEQRKKWLDYYLPHTEELEKITGKDLTLWKR
jgi:hypothetical protein